MGVQFFAGMIYLRRLAERIPSPEIARLAKTRMIACPIWATVGAILLFLGPLIALVLYYRLLRLVRIELARIVSERTANSEAS